MLFDVKSKNVFSFLFHKQQQQQQQQSPNQQQIIYQRNTIIGSDLVEQPSSDEFIGNVQPYSSATAPRQKKM